MVYVRCGFRNDKARFPVALKTAQAQREKRSGEVSTTAAHTAWRPERLRLLFPFPVLPIGVSIASMVTRHL